MEVEELLFDSLEKPPLYILAFLGLGLWKNISIVKYVFIRRLKGEATGYPAPT
jgi:hypothetical protein